MIFHCLVHDDFMIFLANDPVKNLEVQIVNAWMELLESHQLLFYNAL